MNPKVSIIMGSTSDLKVMEEAMIFLEEMEVPFEVNAFSAHRTPDLVEKIASSAHDRGVRVFIAAAGGAAHLPGVVAAFTPIPVIGVPINSSNSVKGIDSLLSIVQMPSGIPVATVAIDGARNAAILAVQMLATGDADLYAKLVNFKKVMKEKVISANKKTDELNFKFIVK